MSNDSFLGQPFNIASYALLVHMLAQVTGLEVGYLMYSGGDVHVYKSHLDGVKTQLQREPKQAPVLKIDTSITDIHDFTIDSFELLNYEPDEAIKAPMAV